MVDLHTEGVETLGGWEGVGSNHIDILIVVVMKESLAAVERLDASV